MLTYLLIRIITFPLAFLSFAAIHRIGNALGLLAYYTIPKFRKRSLSNLAMAKDLSLSNEEILTYAKKSMQSLAITCLEYPKLARCKDLSKLVICETPEEAAGYQGAVFFCGHQANWELLFLEGTMRMPGVAIGRPIKNKHLYKWILSIRERFGGKIITPKEAVKEGLRAIKQGKFIGIVGDQALPETGLYHPFLGRPAWTSPLPALLSYRTGAPLFVASTVREKGRYRIRYSKAILPNRAKPAEEEVPRMMKEALCLFEKSIKEHPEQWMWQHNRWKQQTLERLPKLYRQDTIAIVADRKDVIQRLSLFRDVYPRESITAFIPDTTLDLPGIEVRPLSEVFKQDYRFKLLYNFTESKKIDRHFSKLSLVKAIHLNNVDQLKEVVHAR